MAVALFATVVLLLLPAPVAVPTSADETDEQLLERFKAAVRNKRELGGWIRGDSVCQFPGAGCVGSRLSSLSLAGVPLDVDFRAVAGTLLRLGSVRTVSLRGANVTGSLEDASGERLRCGHMLAKLDLSGNGALLRGHVADAAVLAGACGGLRELNLSRNALVGGRRKGDGGVAGFAGLDVLDLSYNRIAGDLSWIASAVGVWHLGLAGNMISGLIPPLSNCSRMESLDLSRNDISGEVVPGVISGCSALVTLDLSNNLNLTGAFPPDILGFASLSYLNLSFNSFSDGLPAGDSLAAGIPRVATLSLSYNYFNGSLPDTMGSLAELTTLELNSNALTGVILPSFCPSTGTSKLEVLHLQNNYLTGGIPPSISNCASLQSLDLALNYINGSIPTSLGDLSLLRDIILWENQLHGEIPASLASTRGLQHLILDYNGLTGGIPPELVNCHDLIWLSLGSNKLSGPVPPWLGQLDNMANLKLNNNSFSGPIPRELGDCKRLILLDLNNNQLSGPIPPELARQSGKVPILDSGRTSTYLRNQGSRTGECHDSGNLLHTSGIRSDDLNRMASKKLCNFIVLHLSCPDFTSTLNASMEYLDLSFNQLDSEIPKELGNINYLFLINLGSNLLSGAIPDELGDAKTLSSLDLSHNQLEGPIPGSLSTLGLLQYIDLSYNKLNGSVPVLGSLATFPESQYENNSGLCGIPLPPCLPISSLHGRHHSGHNYHLLKLTILLACVTVALGVIGFFLYLAMIKKTEKGQVRASVDDPVGHQLISHLELVHATDKFNEDNMLGSGGFGKVFRGQLSNGSVVAVKVLDMRSEQTTRSFDAECRVLRMARHRNLIQIINACSNMDFRAMVLQYMPNGSLDTLLHHSHLRERQFGFHERLGVMLDVSMALEYLHHGYHEVVLHCDLKPSNVLFDEDMIAHVADFGIARLLQGNDSSTIASNMPSSIGYMSPEYGSYGKASRKSDVFSYGIMLLEVFTGRKHYGRRGRCRASKIHGKGHNLHGKAFAVQLRPAKFGRQQIGLLCTKDSPKDRIKISDVVLRLTKIQIAYTKWTTRHNDL
ncbi:brassinosteroid LRR receptor kinase BRI1-like [Lolium perenne]|uniref:brassinosteroid LRR receptor kinase BRI1-like n=1 Tax=Lolium perenne TaxID=4522 RepID=UPI003A99A56D